MEKFDLAPAEWNIMECLWERAPQTGRELYLNDEFFEAPSEENIYLTIANPKLHILYEDENILLLRRRWHRIPYLLHWNKYLA